MLIAPWFGRMTDVPWWRNALTETVRHITLLPVFICVGFGKSGLGLEAQQAALARFAETEGYLLVETFQEVETGKGSDALDRRPQLSAALKTARKHKAPIIVAKLDRLSRDVHFSRA
jgi:hypothetical protein